MKNDTFVFTAIIIKEKEGYSALCLDIDIASEGDNQNEAKSNLIEAINLYIETAIENNLPTIRPVSNQDNPLNTKNGDIIETFKIKVDLQVNAHV